MNAAIIGVSGFADRHLRDLMELASEGKLRLTAATVINQSEEREKCRELRAMGCELFSDYTEMFATWNGRLDLCVIPTGIHLHARMTIAALAAGCNVLVEKPAAATIDEVDAMREAESGSSRFVAVGYQHIYSPGIKRIKEAMLGGLIGRVEAIKCKGLWQRADWYYSRNDWAGRLRLGEDWILDAPFNNAFAHYLNIQCYLAGSSMCVSARPTSIRAELYRTREIEASDTACMRVDTEEGIALLLWVTHSCPKPGKEDEGPEMEIRGSNGSILWTPERIIHRDRNGVMEQWLVDSFEEIRRAMLDAVLQKLAGEDAFVCDLNIARVQTLCGSAAFDSSEVHSIPDTFLLHKGFDGARHVEIKGIDKLCDSAFQLEQLWSEMFVPWARKGRVVDVRETVKSSEDGIAAVRSMR